MRQQQDTDTKYRKTYNQCRNINGRNIAYLQGQLIVYTISLNEHTSKSYKKEQKSKMNIFIGKRGVILKRVSVLNIQDK